MPSKQRQGLPDTEAGSSRPTERKAVRLGQCSGMTPSRLKTRRPARTETVLQQSLCTRSEVGLGKHLPIPAPEVPRPTPWPDGTRSEERRVGKSVDLGGSRIIKKKKTKSRENTTNY